MTKWQPIETAPRDGTKIVGWCNHEADKYFLPNGNLTDYGAAAEGMSHAEDGPQIVEWVEGSWDIDEFRDKTIHYPSWWFVSYTDGECAANPTHWTPLPPPPEEETG